MAEEKASAYRVVFITAAATAGVVVLAMMMIFLLSSRQSDVPILANESAKVPVLEGPAKIPTKIEYRKGLAFFNPTNGEPAIWYHKLADGSYDLFDWSGFHPTYGKEAPLQAVTPTIVGDIEAYFKERAEPVRTAANRVPSRRTVQSQVQRQSRAVAPAPAPESVGPVSRTVTIPAGTRLDVVSNQRLSTETNQVNETFGAILVRPVVIDGETVLEQGVSLTGRIIDLERPGKASGVAKLTLVLTGISENGESEIPIATAPLTFEGKASKGKDVAKVGIGTAIGAALGGLFGGGKGAAKGAAVGAGGGAGAVLATRGEDLVLPPEQALTFTLVRNATVQK